MLPYGRQHVDDEDRAAVMEVLGSDWLTTGPAVEAFEDALSAVAGSEHAVAFCNGTAALHAAMNALGIQPGDEVIVPAITFVATANGVLYQGGKPVFADVDAGTLRIDPEDVERKITSRTKAIVAMDYAGQPCEYGRLRELADRHGLALVADACHSLGGRYAEQSVGSLADMTCFSFHPVKPITTAEGGAVTTSNPDHFRRLKTFRNHGIDSDFRQRATEGRHAYGMVELGFNYRLNDLQAALGTSQLKKLSIFTEQRKRLANLYADELAKLNGGVGPLLRDPQCESAWHLYVVRCPETPGRDLLFNQMRERGIGCNVHYLPVYQHPYYRDVLGYAQRQCPVAEAAYERILTLPLFPAMSEADVRRVCQTLGECLKMEGRLEVA